LNGLTPTPCCKKGWDEKAFVEDVVTVAWANYVKRVAFGLGLFADF